MASEARDGVSSEYSGVVSDHPSEGGARIAAPKRTQGEQVGIGETLELGREGVRYEVVRSLGRGGMGEVFLARRLGAEGFDREVALKCIAAGLEADEGVRKAFLYEAKLASRLRHPNIAEAYDLAQVGDQYYLVLEYVDGVTAKAILRAARRERRQLSEGFCCHVVASVAEGLHYAHGLSGPDGQPLGIVHRDIKPANVMVARSGAVKLLDFGIAHARIEGRDRTETGTLKGTYAYFSPEQASSEATDARSDLFSLGVILVELLTGKRVFEAGSDLGTIRKIGDCATADVRAVTQGLPARLSEICERALAKKPGDRFQDGAEFSRALRSYSARAGATFWTSDCAAEVRALGAFGNVSAEAEPGDASASSLAAEDEDARPSVALGREDGSRRRRAVLMLSALGAGIVVAGTLVTGRVLAKRSDLGEHGGAVPVAAVVPVLESKRDAPVTQTGRAELVAAVGTQPGAREKKIPIIDGPVVRPRSARGAVTPKVAAAPVEEAIRERRASVETGSSETEFADRRSVANASLTLGRGTLVPAKLVRAIDAERPSDVEAVVTDDVASEGLVVVPRGSTVACRSRASSEGRVPLSCDAIRTTDRRLLFSGLAVGEGQHVGLRVLDTEVPAGTSFVVYVNEAAALR